MRFFILIASFYLLAMLNFSNSVDGFSFKPWHHHKRGKTEAATFCGSLVGAAASIVTACNAPGVDSAMAAVAGGIGFCSACGTAYVGWKAAQKAKIEKGELTVDGFTKKLAEIVGIIKKEPNNDKKQKLITDYFHVV
ncbi:hypothetical protein K502DRAFT_346764 [Neoconidiobolus thromboides FSU 785]|nr:hypothetical protein K502DRAFT_346764 [Neoconidiobolus thromboides FSU 785]